MTAPSRLSDDALTSILSAGIRAPSADNRHLFRFAPIDEGVLIVASDAYAAATTQTRLLAWISFGAAVENMAVEATRFGLRAEPTWFASDRVVCELRFAPLSVAPDSLADAIPARCTNRRFFGGPALEHDEKTQLESAVTAVSGARVGWLDDVPARKQALKLMTLAESERFKERALHAELFSGLRFDIGNRGTCAEGIPIGAAEIEWPARRFFRLMRRWTAMRLLNYLGAYRIAGSRAASWPARLSPHLGVIVAEGEIRTAAVQAGRALERLWLSATSLGLAFQPMAAAALYALDAAAEVRPSLRRVLANAWKPLIGGAGTPLMVFRLGRARAPSVRSGRPPLSSFLPGEAPPA